MYAGCVYWPLKLDSRIGLTAAGAVVLMGLIEYFVGLRRRLRENEAARVATGPADGS